MTLRFSAWVRRALLCSVLLMVALGLLIARAPEQVSVDTDLAADADPSALDRIVVERRAALAALPADADPLSRAQAEVMLADAERTLAELDGAAGAAEEALRLYSSAGRRLRSVAEPRLDLLGHVELHRGEVLTLLGRTPESASAFRTARDAFTAAGLPIMAEVAEQRLSRFTQ